MSAQNIEIARLALSNLSSKDRAALLRELAGHATEQPPERLLRRADVARRLSCSLRLVDLLAARGTLTRIRLPGRQRGNGFLQSQVDRLITAKGEE